MDHGGWLAVVGIGIGVSVHKLEVTPRVLDLVFLD
jgi:hypothetical protein